MISKKENNKLVIIPLSEEIHHAFFKMLGAKALGLNGFNALLYKRCWDIVGKNW